MTSPSTAQNIEYWPIDRLVEYPRNPRKNDNVVDRMCCSIREFGFKIPVLARSDGEIVDGHLRLKAARKLDITEVPVILCDEWSPAQVKAFRLMVNRSVSWAEWDEELLALELQEIQASDFDLSLTGLPKSFEAMRFFLQTAQLPSRARWPSAPLSSEARLLAFSPRDAGDLVRHRDRDHIGIWLALQDPSATNRRHGDREPRDVGWNGRHE